MSKDNTFFNVQEENVRPYINHVFVDYLRLPDRELKVLLALKSFAWNNKNDCFPTLATLGKICDKGRSQLSEVINILEKKELIRIETSPGGVNTYFITNKELKNDQQEKRNPEIRKSGIRKSGKDPVRKSVLPPSGNPDETRPEIRTLSNISNNKKKKEQAVRKKREPISDSFYPNQENQKLADRRAAELGVNGAYLIQRFIEVQKEYETKSEDFNLNFKEFLNRQKSSKRQGMSNNEQIPTSTKRYTDYTSDHPRGGDFRQVAECLLPRYSME